MQVYARLVTSLLFLGAAFPASAIEAGRASGTVRIEESALKANYAWAKRQGDNIVVTLTDREVATSILNGFSALDAMEDRGEVKSARITINPKDKSYQIQIGDQFVSSTMADGQMTLSLTSLTENEIEATAAAEKGAEVFGHPVALDVSFHATIGGENYAINPVAQKQLAARVGKLPDGSAKGTLRVDGKAIPLKHAYAYRAKNAFDRKKTDTVVLLSDRPLTEEEAGRKTMGEALGVVVTVGPDQLPYHLGIHHPALPNGGQVSGSGGFAGFFDSAILTEERIEGNAYSEENQEFLGNHKFDFKADFRTPVITAEDPTDFVLDSNSGKKLPKGGGEPGKAFLAYDRAFRSGKLEEIAKFRSNDAAGPDLADMSAEDREMVSKMLELAKMMRPKSVRIVDGYVDGDRATLYVQGPSTTEEGATDYGTISMAREAGVWKIMKESWSNKPENP